MVLTTLCDEFKVHQTKKNKYVLFENSIYKKGRISVAKGGYGFVDFGGKRDAFIHIKDLNGAKDGDLVAIEVTLQNKDKCEGKVVKVGPRKEKALVGEVVTKKKRTYIVLDDKKEDMTVILDAKKHNLKDGMKVIVTLKDEVSKNTFTADVKEVLGHKDDPGVDLLSIIKQYGIVTEFPEEVVKAVEEFGVFKGGWLGIKRICRCVPWQKKRGYDPVPINIKGDNLWILKIVKLR